MQSIISYMYKITSLIPKLGVAWGQGYKITLNGVAITISPAGIQASQYRMANPLNNIIVVVHSCKISLEVWYIYVF